MLRVVLRRQRRPASPVYDGDFPDPFVLVVGDRSFAYGTQTGDMNLQVMVSADLVGWQHRGDALPELPPWAASGNTWAPAVLERNGSYVMYYVVRYAAAGRQAISVATASDPAGPFEDRSSEPLIFQEDHTGSIDPSPFVDEDGAAYLLWKGDDNAVDLPASLWGAPLHPDGLTLAAEPTELLRHDAAWEQPLIEAPSLARVGKGTYVLFYSGGWWENETYAIGYATGGGPLGPFHKDTETGPWLASGEGMAGPGGAEVFTDADGGWHLAFHAWTPPRVGYENGGARSLWIEPIDFADGRPVLR
jgi:beta-xylosidase